MRLFAILWFSLMAAASAADEPLVTFQIRGEKDLRVRSTESVKVPEDKRSLSMTKFLQSLATGDCGAIKAMACRLGEIYRIDPSDKTAHEIYRSHSRGDTEPTVDTLHPGDIVVFYQSGYCCGY